MSSPNKKKAVVTQDPRTAEEMANLTSQLKIMTVEYNSTKIALDETKKNFYELREQHNQLAKGSKKLLVRDFEYRKANEELTIKARKLEADIVLNTETITELDADKKELERKLNSAAQTVQTQIQYIKELDESREGLRAEVTKLKDEIHNLANYEEAFRASEAEVARLVKELEATKGPHSLLVPLDEITNSVSIGNSNPDDPAREKPVDEGSQSGTV
jgi:chromosome segregation ATPase